MAGMPGCGVVKLLTNINLTLRRAERARVRGFVKFLYKKVGQFNKSLTEPCGRILQTGRYNDTSFAGKRSASETETPPPQERGERKKFIGMN